MKLKLVMRDFVADTVMKASVVGTALTELYLGSQRKVTTQILKNMHEGIREHAAASRAAHKCVEKNREFERKKIQYKMNVSEINFSHLLSRVPHKV